MNYLGIDLGGTNVRVAKIDDHGNVLNVVSGPSYSQESAEKITNNIINLIKQIDYSDCEGVGIGVPGPVDTIRNVMTMATNIPSLLNYPIGDKIKESTGLNVYMDNDANVAGLAEATVGAGKGKRIVYYFTHSTGIGGALIFNGKVISGRNGYAGEIGNIIVNPNASKVNHLNAGSVENEASGTGLAMKGKEAGLDINDAKDVFDLAYKGNEIALKLIDNMAREMALMMSSISHVCDPDCYVIGGGCSHSSDLYFDKLGLYLNELVHEGMKDVPIYKASLKEPGVVGAAMLVKFH